MTIQELKTIIESGSIPECLVILRYSDSDFVPNQYIDFIKNKYQVEPVESYEDCIVDSIGLFDTNEQSEEAKVLRTETFDCGDERLKNSKRTIVVCKKISKQAQSLFGDFVVDIPKLEQWQIDDYAYSIAEGVNQKDLKKLVDTCKGDIYRLDRELQKLSIFPREQRQFMFQKFVEDGVFSDLSMYTIFNLTSCIVRRDVGGLFNVYRELDNIDVEPVGLLVLLCQNFKDIIDVQLSKDSSAETLGMNPKKYWAVKKSCGHYTKDELIHIYSFLTSLDKKIKTGEMPVEHLIDYMITKVITCV